MSTATVTCRSRCSRWRRCSSTVEDHGREHVGVEPSGDAFSSIDFDERQQRPHNPMVNAGALVTADLFCGSAPSW